MKINIYLAFSITLISAFLFSQDINNLKLPELGDRVSGAVSSNEERIIGKEFFIVKFIFRHLIY